MNWMLMTFVTRRFNSQHTTRPASKLFPTSANETLVNCMNDLVVSNNYNRLWSGIIQNIRFKMFKCIDTNKH